jgi:hypothetical protein
MGGISPALSFWRAAVGRCGAKFPLYHIATIFVKSIFA